MSELLRLANDLIEAREKAAPGVWERDGRHIDNGLDWGCGLIRIYDEGGHNKDDAEFIVQAANNAVDVIKGYQELLRGIIGAFDSTPEHELSEVLSLVLRDARPAIPEEPRQ